MISFQNQSIDFKLKDKTRLKQWIKDIILSEKKKPGPIAYIFCNDDELLKVNLAHLNHNTYTDIITFDYTEDAVVSGDILISIDRVRENAGKFGVSFEEELHRVMIHGVLHLCGYKDKSKEQSALMRKKENSALKKF